MLISVPFPHGKKTVPTAWAQWCNVVNSPGRQKFQLMEDPINWRKNTELAVGYVVERYERFLLVENDRDIIH